MRSFLAILFFIPLIAASQIKEFDKLEMLYDQGHYTKVLRGANRLLDNPEYDFSLLPLYYKSVAMFQLYRNDKWRKRNPKALEEAVELFQMVKREDQGGKIFSAHYYEVQSLKKDLQSFAEQAKQNGDEALHARVNNTIKTVFSGIVGLDELESIVERVEDKEVKEAVGHKGVRTEIVSFAQNYVGTPYKPGGMDPKGFDCSGFTTFVFNKFGKQLPRTANDQQKLAKKVDLKKAQSGDLVFFNSGNGVNHVGIVVVNQNGAIKMVHASTSQGIVITDIESSSYWSKRIHSAGAYLD